MFNISEKHSLSLITISIRKVAFCQSYNKLYAMRVKYIIDLIAKKYANDPRCTHPEGVAG